MKATERRSNRLSSNSGEDKRQNYLEWQKNPEKLFEEGQFELWYQPVYQAESGAVIHNEVLLRWRDEQGNLYLPNEFMPAISGAGLLPRVDRLVISRTINCLSLYPELQLSVNISESTLKYLNLIQDLQLWLNSAKVQAKRLNFEVTESAIASEFSSALEFIQGLKNLGCRVVIDDFSGRQLSLFQCQELAVDSIKLNHQFLQSLNTTLAKTILEFGQSIGLVTAKCITDDTTLKLVKQAGLNGLQGNRLKMAASHPEMLPWNDSNEIATIDLTPHSSLASPLLPLPEVEEKSSLWKRLLFGTTFIGIGATALIIGILSVNYRLSNFVVDNGRINGKIVRLRAPIDGKVETFYASPGAVVKSAQVLARIVPSEDVEQELLQLEQEVQSKSNQLAAGRDSLEVLQSRLQRQEGEYDRLWDVEVIRDNQDVSQKRSLLNQAIAEANAASADYQRLEKLYQQGAVTKQRVDAAKANLEVAQAGVKQAQDALGSSEQALGAAEKRVAMNVYSNWGDGYVQETSKLRQQIEEEIILTKTLSADLEVARKRLDKAQTKYNQSKEIEIKAPLSAVVYTTDREQGELIKQSEEILSLVDCSSIWVDAIVDAKKATNIDTKSPVLVHLAGEKAAIKGEISLVQAVSSQGDYERSQRLEVEALLPIVPPELVGKPLSRIKVTIPPPQNYADNNQFCGLGQPARLTFAVNDESIADRLLRWKPQWLGNGTK